MNYFFLCHILFSETEFTSLFHTRNQHTFSMKIKHALKRTRIKCRDNYVNFFLFFFLLFYVGFLEITLVFVCGLRNMNEILYIECTCTIFSLEKTVFTHHLVNDVWCEHEYEFYSTNLNSESHNVHAIRRM